MDRLVPLTDAHELYRLAAWAFHHGDGLSWQARRGLYVGLLAAWPRERRGQSRDYWSDSYAAQAVEPHGASVDDVAEAFSITSDAARRKVSRGLTAVHAWQKVKGERIVVVTGEEARGILDADRELLADEVIARAPADPASDAEWLEVMIPASRRAGELSEDASKPSFGAHRGEATQLAAALSRPRRGAPSTHDPLTPCLRALALISVGGACPTVRLRLAIAALERAGAEPELLAA